MMSLLASLEESAFSKWLLGSDSIWAFPTVLTLHALGTMVLVGASAMLDLRLLGVGGRIPLGSLRPLFPLMWGGFGLNFVTGSMLFIAEATSKGTMPMFFVKLGFVAAGTLTIVLIRREVFGAAPEPGTVNRAARLLAVVSLVVWMSAITAGRLLAYVA